MQIRMCSAMDSAQLYEIYRPVVEYSAISFELTPPSADEMAERIAKILERFPWIVYDEGGRILGYAYASPHRERAAYQWSVDVSVYVHESARGRGIGKALYTSLIEILRLQGFCNAYAGIALPNPASIALHESLGFSRIASYSRVGFKHGEWRDVGWWSLRLSEVATPEEPQWIGEIARSSEFREALLLGVSAASGRAHRISRGSES